MYQAFGGKKELFLACMERYRARIGQRLEQLLKEAPSGAAFIETVLLNSAAEAAKPEELRRGCLLMNAASEFAQKDGAIARQVSCGFEGLREFMRRAVVRGQAEGGISPELDADKAASYLISSLGGIKMLVKGGAGEAQVRDIVAMTLRALR